MPFDPPPALFVTGTDTGVGKTLVAAVLMAGLGGTYWKPVQSGTVDGTDTGWVRRHTGLASSHFLPETYCFKAPLSPHAAARLESVNIRADAFRLPALTVPPLIVEGAGGVMAPLGEGLLMVDLIRWLGLPVLLVARTTLGTISHTLLSLDKLRAEKIPILGVVMNGPANPSNRRAIETYGHVEVLAQIAPMRRTGPRALRQTFERLFK